MIEIKNNVAGNVYEAFLDGKVAGACHYRLDGKTITFTHTVVDPAFEGKGFGSALAKHVLDDSRALGLKVQVAIPLRAYRLLYFRLRFVGQRRLLNFLGFCHDISL